MYRATDSSSPAKDYYAHSARTAEVQRAKTAAAQEISPLPEVVDPERKAKACESFGFFCQTYFPNAFTLPWAPFHERACEKMERAALRGGTFAFAMPRGSGKTTMCEWFTLWTILSGLRRYVVFVGATETASTKRLASLKTELNTNPLLLEDFPEVVYPIHRLERSVRRADGQKFEGKHTAIRWTQNVVVLPSIPGSKAAGSIIEVCGITGEIRGKNHKTETGQVIRPELAICDDPQTRESARSITQSTDREAVIAGDVSYLAGTDRPIAVVMPCTVIYPGDLADRLLNREHHPTWQGERTKMVLEWPTNEKLWLEYQRIREDSFRNGGDGSEATEFYSENREEMDEGHKVSWPQWNPGPEISAIEKLINLRNQDEAAFLAEFQNEPIESQTDILTITADEIAAKTIAVPRGMAPANHNYVTAFIDVQGNALYWSICSWEDDFTGFVVDYGTFPEQPLRMFSLRNMKRTLAHAYPEAETSGQIYAALSGLCTHLLAKRIIRQPDNFELRIGRILIDANWAQQTDTVYQFCSEFEHDGRIMPSHGVGLGANVQPWSEHKRQPGETLGTHWRIPTIKRSRSIKHVIIDTNWWKSQLLQRWRTAKGDSGSVSVYGKLENGRAVQRGEHNNFAEHQCAEIPYRVQGRKRTVEEWRQKESKPDNHWLDCMVGCCVGASMLGVKTVGASGVALQQGSRTPRVITSATRAS